MSKKVVALNAGPRRGWNTDTLLTEAAKGAEENGADIIRFDLFKLEKYTGCISCVKRQILSGTDDEIISATAA
jgi:multimeric flavodoxin WrbA